MFSHPKEAAKVICEMKNSKFAFISLFISLLFIVQAAISFVDIPETNPLAVIFFPISLVIYIIYLPEDLLGFLPFSLDFPIIMPILSVIFALVSFYKKEDKKILSAISIILILAGILLFLAPGLKDDSKIAPVSTFEECAVTGNPILESYPRQCKMPDGKVFVEKI